MESAAVHPDNFTACAFELGFSGNQRRIASLVETGTVKKRDRDYRPAAATMLNREYKGVEYRVTATADGQYDFQGRMFPSLSMIAREITGMRCAVYTRKSTDEGLDQE